MSIVFFFDQKTPRRRPYHRTKKTIDDVFISRPLTAHYRLKRNSTFKKKRRSTFLSPTQGLSSSDEASTPLLSASIAKVGSDGAFAREGVDKEEAAVTQTEETAPSNGVLPPVDVHTVSPPLISATSAALTSSRLKILAELEEERDDDGQEQYSFQEAQFAAPGILQQLSKLIYLADREEAIKWCPEGLIATLRSEYRSLTRGVKVARRQWQTVSYRYTAEMSREESEGDVRLPIIVMEGSDGERRKEGRTRRRLEMSVSISEVEMLKEEQKANGDDVGAVPSIFGLGREMSKSPRGQQPRTRLERYHVVGVHERGVAYVTNCFVRLCNCLSFLSDFLFVCLLVCPCVSVCLSVCLFYICLSVLYLSVCLSVCLSACLSTRSSTCLCVCLYVCVSVCLFVCPSVFPSVCRSVCLFFVYV